MISSFATQERKPVWTRTSLPASVHVQRKCECGKAPCSCGRAWKHTATQSRHNFGEIKIHPELMTARDSSPMVGRIAENANADTGCDVSKGDPQISVHYENPCYKQCTQRHEEVHRKDIAPCCKKANKAWGSAKTDDQKTAVQDKMNQWVLDNESLLQCRAFHESVKCADEFLDAHCRGKQAEGGASTAEPATATEARGDETQDPAMNRGPASEGVTNSGVAALSEDKPDETPIDPQRCCYTVKDYWRHAGWRRDAYCKDAKAGLTPCPF